MAQVPGSMLTGVTICYWIILFSRSKSSDANIANIFNFYPFVKNSNYTNLRRLSWCYPRWAARPLGGHGSDISCGPPPLSFWPSPSSTTPEADPSQVRKRDPSQVRKRVSLIFITARVCSTTGRYCFHRCVSVHTGVGEGFAPSPSHNTSTGPCPFWGVPSDWSQVPSGGYTGQVRMGGGTSARSRRGYPRTFLYNTMITQGSHYFTLYNLNWG